MEREEPIQDHPLEGEFLGTVRVGRLVTSIPRAVAAGITLAPGLFFLLAGPAVGMAGVDSLSALLFVTIVLGLTLLNIFELLGGSSSRGGTSSLVYESLGSFSGYLSGFALMGSFLAFSVAILRVAGEQLQALFPQLALSSPIWGLGILLALCLIQVFRTLPKRGWTIPTVFWSFTLLVVVFSAVIPAVDRSLYQGPPSGEFMHTVGWLLVTFAPLEALMVSRRLGRESGKRMPTSLLWTLFVSAALLGIVELILAGLPSMYVPGSDSMVVEALFARSGLAPWFIRTAALLALIFAANASLMTAARQLHLLTRWGAFPHAYLSVKPPFRLPPLIFATLGAVAVPFLLWTSTRQLVEVTTGLLILPIIMVNLAAIWSRRNEPDRRRTFLIPFYPLVPLVALGLSVAILFALPRMGILWGAAWILLAVVFYQVYARTQLIEALEGVRVFGPRPEEEKKAGAYRILVPLNTGVERRTVLEMATALASQMGGELIALQVVVIPDPLAGEQGQRIAKERNTLFQWSTRFADNRGIPVHPITRLARSIHEGILQTAVEEECDLIFLSWNLGDAPRSARLGRVLDPVIRSATCDVVLLALPPEFLKQEQNATAQAGAGGRTMPLPIEKILVTTAGGPHAPLASRIALLLAREFNATTSGVYIVSPDASSDEIAEGNVRIENTLEAMRQQASDLPAAEKAEGALTFESRVVKAESVLEGIVQAGAESDLVLIGASEESLIDQVLLGTLPEDVARSSPTPVMMVKRYQGLRRFWLQRLWGALFGVFPTLSAEDRIDVYRRVRRSARPDVDFFVMIGLSAIIASYGLFQDSSAVIIGGMLVAPLFTPILGISLAIVRGDIHLFRLAIEAALKGIVLAIGVAIAITAISPLRSISLEIGARVSPDLFDLAVALASGAAGAYAVARKDVAAALPGVAIAAALVPPLCVVGIGIALPDAKIASGSALLFSTNLVAIVLAGAVTLLLLGFRPAEHGEREARLRVGLIASLVLLVVITVPLAVVFSRSVDESRTRQRLNRVIEEQIARNEQTQLLNFEFEEQDEVVQVTARIYSDVAPSTDLVDTWRGQMSEALDRPVDLELISIPIQQVQSTHP